jgi:RNA polymerase-associated protein RTF1
MTNFWPSQATNLKVSRKMDRAQATRDHLHLLLLARLPHSTHHPTLQLKANSRKLQHDAAQQRRRLVRSDARSTSLRKKEKRKYFSLDELFELHSHLSHSSSAPSSPGSLGSGAMDESDSDTSPGDVGDAGDDDNLYPLEGKFRDAADRAEIMGMSMLDREQVLANRIEEQAERKRGKNLRSMVGEADRVAEKSKNKRKAGAADLEDDDRKTIRPRTKRSDALESYTRQRDQAREEKSRRANRVSGGRRSRSRSRDSSERDANGESDEEYGRSKVRAPEPEIPVELPDIQRVKVGRTNFAKVCFFPGFEQTMIGCFARVCIGQEKPGMNTYRLTQIKGVTTGKPYFMDIPNNPFYTDQYVVLAHGKAEKEWPFTFCSDSKIGDSEFERWKKQLVVDSLPVPSRSTCNSKCEKINKLISHRFTSDELNEKLEKQHKYRHLLTQSQPKATLARTTSSNDQQNNLRLLNEKNRKQNAENVRKALVAEKNRQRSNARAKAAEIAAANKEQMLAVPRSDVDALFSEGSDISRTATPVQDAPGKKPDPPKEKGGIPKFTKMSMDDDIIGTMDLGIDIDI